MVADSFFHQMLQKSCSHSAPAVEVPFAVLADLEQSTAVLFSMKPDLRDERDHLNVCDRPVVPI